MVLFVGQRVGVMGVMLLLLEVGGSSKDEVNAYDSLVVVTALRCFHTAGWVTVGHMSHKNLLQLKVHPKLTWYSGQKTARKVWQSIRLYFVVTHTHNHFTALSGTTGGAGARRNSLDFIVQRKISEADTLTIRLGATQSGLISDPPSYPVAWFSFAITMCISDMPQFAVVFL